MGTRGTRALVVVAAACALAPSASAQTPPAPDPPPSLHVDGARLADDAGGTVLLRGGALIRKSAPGLPTVTAGDWEGMRRLGWNSIRLGISWRFIEPQRGVYDTAHLDRLAALAREAMANGLHVVVDMHQDVWGPPVGNGAPQWTVYPECAPLHVDLAGATGTWAANYLSPWTFCQFTRFWDDLALQRRYAAAWVQVARRLGAEPGLAGYDLMNEPFQGFNPPGEFEQLKLYPFYRRVAAAIRAVDPDAIVFEEPANSKNVHLPTTLAVDPGTDAVYAPHVYGLWDANDAFTERAALVEANMSYSQAEARAMGTPLWYGEFGMRRSAPDAERTLTQIYDLADAQLAGTALWEWLDPAYGPRNFDGSLDPTRSFTVSRPYPRRTGGELLAFTFGSETGRFIMRWRQVADGGPTVVYLPDVRYPTGYAVETDPDVTFTAQPDQLIEVTAPPGEHELAISPR